MLAVAFVTIRVSTAASDTSSEKDTIGFGVTNSTLIVSGKFLNSQGSGDWLSGTAKIVQVFKAPKGFNETNTVAVFWLMEKEPQHELVGTNTFLLFLRPARGVPFTSYEDATEQKHSFVPASNENIRLLKSRLKDFAVESNEKTK